MSDDHLHALGGAYRAQREANIDTWTVLFRQAWRTSLDSHRFELTAKKAFAKTPLNDLEIFQAWSNQIAVQRKVSARMLGYLETLQRLKIVKEITILNYIIIRLGDTFAKAGDPKARATASAEIAALLRMTSNTMHRLQSKTPKKRAPEVQITMRLLKLIGLFAGSAVARGGIVSGIALALGEAIAGLLIAHINELSITGILTAQDGKPPTGLKRAFSNVVPAFIEVLSASASPQAASLTLLQQQSKLQEGMEGPTEEVPAPNMEAISFTAVPHMAASIAPTRASLYAYLTAALIATPRLDDLGLQAFLAARYHEDIPTMATDLITTGFDVLAGALERKESPEVQIIHKSFISNKLPAMLEQLAQHSSFQSGEKPMGGCVEVAIKRVGESYRNTPVLQQGSEACPRQRFLLSCALFGFIQESSIPSLMGYLPTKGLPTCGRYDKAKLIQECQAGSKRIEQLVGELHLMEGNASAITRALLEILHTLCASRDTMTLRILCLAFLKKPHNINIMLLFASPRVLLQPLCQVLDHWQAQDDQGEQQIVYDEFGSILLFVLMCQYRYELPLAAFTTPPSDGAPASFISEYFQTAMLPKHSSNINDQERRQLSGWVKGIFENNGLTDELLSTCPPKEFYRLAATLADQIMIATQMGVLGIETANAGIDFFLEPFLLPSLIIVLAQFAARLSSMSSDSPQLDFLMPILVRLVKPPQISGDAERLHQDVLFISARPLVQALAQVSSKQRKDVPQLMNALKNHLQKPFTLGAARPLLEEWCNTKDSSGKSGGVATAFQHSIDNILKWNQPGKTVPDRQAYNHRLTVFATSMLGAPRALDIILDQASKASTNPKATDAALDTMTGLIAGSSLTIADHKLSLVEALHRADQEAQARQATRENSARTSFIARLRHRIEEHCAKPLEQVPAIITIPGVDDADTIMADAIGQAVNGLDAATATAAAAAASSAVDMKDLQMGNTQDLMAGSEEAAKGADASVPGQQDPGQMSLGDGIGLGGMDGMDDLGYSDYLNDMSLEGSQNFDDIFSQL